MRAVAYRPITVEDYQHLPSDGRQYQVVEGELYVAPAPNRFHQSVLGNFYRILANFLVKNPCGKIFLAPFDVYLDDINVVQPDLCVFLAERFGRLSDRGAEGSPDLVVEILSPQTGKLDVGAKKELYARSGVTEMWIVDPKKRTVQVFFLQESTSRPVATYSGVEQFGTRLLPRLRIACAAVFAE
jgi:Uma2 family endonuclease